MPTSPRYQLASGKKDAAMATLGRIAKANKIELPEGELLPASPVKRGRVQDLVKPGHRRTGILLALLW